MSGPQEMGIRVVAVVLSKARTDSEFRKKLLADPNGALTSLGIDVPAGVAIRFVEDTPTLWHFVIPGPRGDGELSESDLDKVAGGMAPMQLGRPRNLQ